MSGKAPTRSYVSTLRTEQAATTRRRILEAAAACFTENGYSGTSLADIAARAGVSPETVKNNGPKRELLLGAFEQAFAGTEGPAPVVDSDPAQEILAITDADAFLTATAAFVAAANARTSVLWIEFLAAANADALVAAALDDLLARRRADYRGVVEQLIERGIASGSQDRDAAAATLSFLWSPESHQQLVLQGGWAMERYEVWLADAAQSQLAA
ncbi:TetR/AcrR family transcriptional regulator [Leifsonia flava]|uniref:TetR/AcrR family transcriptional regulator n=1 Tax=Orlajensenia leifsoniae TaxID=2561933 RepID=A0A4Y9QSH7_9MICO|nr:TetR/AcrR family transcriptional regulator [Leifsonia flava]TFV95414.1 TetR/AcrR family transcriptional regulator [Leifsonia flava]